jgi:hypothetical protein
MIGCFAEINDRHWAGRLGGAWRLLQLGFPARTAPSKRRMNALQRRYLSRFLEVHIVDGVGGTRDFDRLADGQLGAAMPGGRTVARSEQGCM